MFSDEDEITIKEDNYEEPFSPNKKSKLRNLSPSNLKQFTEIKVLKDSINQLIKERRTYKSLK